MLTRTLVGALLCLATAAVSGQTRTGESTEAGAQLFRTYCASCHGVSARGDGPMAQELRTNPPDLTKFTALNRGVFPRERLRRIIDGADVAAHGNREMPVWGDAFKSAREGLTPDAVKARIDALVRHIEAIQQQAAE